MIGRYGYSTRGSPRQESTERAFRLPGTGTLLIEIPKKFRKLIPNFEISRNGCQKFHGLTALHFGGGN
jgi:hypothetical protein